jgi:hypothetical protein
MSTKIKSINNSRSHAHSTEHVVCVTKKSRAKHEKKTKNFTRSRTSNGVNRDYAAETKNKEGKSTPRSLRVVAGSENQTSEKLGGKN